MFVVGLGLLPSVWPVSHPRSPPKDGESSPGPGWPNGTKPKILAREELWWRLRLEHLVMRDWKRNRALYLAQNILGK